MEKNNTCPAFIADVIRQCEANPSRIAIIDNSGRKSSYAAFLETVERCSGYLKTKEIKSGSFILINLPNSMEYLAIEFSIWLSGCGIVPVNPLYPRERIDFICAHCESPLIIDEKALDEILKSDRLEIFEPTADIAAIYYTSGSTGKPKGVIHTFDTLSHIDCHEEFLKTRAEDCFAIGAPFSFVASLTAICYLRKGACVRLIERETMTDIRKLQSMFDNEDLSGAFISPSTLKQLNLKDNKTLRLIITGSERVSNLQPESSYRLVNLYGMTETAEAVSYFEITKPYQNTPIGKMLSDVEFKIQKDGEICLRGPLSPGYFKDAEQSASLWRRGWLHTGDLGRILPDGNIEYLNRKDWMVKINGQRVETGEIIYALKEMPSVTEAAAKGFTFPDGRQYIVAYYVAETALNEEDIKAFLSKRLAPYMIPTYFVSMDSLPLNMNGKIDIKSLQSPAELKLNEDREIALPENETQRELCEAFESALGISPVGIDDDFFSLGGDSIRVMQLQLACPKINLSSSTVYRFKTVRSIAAALDNEYKVESTGLESGESCSLSKTQEGIFVECMSKRGEALYNNPLLVKITESIDADKLAKACVTAVKAHPNVFASISLDEDGRARQKKNGTEDFCLDVETVSDVEFDGIRTGLVKAFDLLSDRLFRMRLFKTETAVWLFYDFHHIIFDGSSNSVLLEDIERAYRGENVDTESFTGFDLAIEEEKLRKSDFFKECRDWNIKTFCEVDQTSLPDPDRFNDNITFSKFDIDTGISEHAFAKAAERLGVTENVLATGAFGYMLGACTHAKSSAFSTIYNGRKSLRTARTMSMMVKTLPVYCSWNTQTRTGDYFDAVKEQLVGSMAHDLFSFAEICAETAFDSRVLFSYQDKLLERKSLCGSKCEMISLLENATGEPLAVQLFKDNGSLTIRTEYRSNMYTEQYIRSLISCFHTVLSSLIMAHRESLATSIKLVSDDEQKSIIEMGRGLKLDFDKSLTFVKMFRKNVELYPDYTAVVDKDESISYSELDKRSDRLAALLISLGIQKEDFVALMLPRLNLFPISYIACFKCGAAYVPLDYEYPVDRLQYMLEDSQAKVLITTREIYEKKCAEGEFKAAKTIFADEIKDEFKVIDRIDESVPGNLAYMIYTSGTTGRPKGVMIEHHSLTNLVHWFAQTCQIGPRTRVAEHASFSFDGSVPDLMTALCFGGELHILPSEIRKDLSKLYNYFCENKIEGTLLTTQLGMALLKMYDLKLRFLMLGGEKLSGQFKSSVRLYNGYGPTEFTVASSYYILNQDNIPDNIPIGKAVPNTISAIVDSCGRLLPKGIAGELVLIGEQLSRGYWQREDITAERFAQCPFLPGEKMYHTGDLVKWSEDGELLYLGRIDTQIKLRGFRIELGEIESNILKFKGIKSAVAAVKEIAGVQHLCAYYCSDIEIDKEELKAALASSLTDYMVPTSYIRMESMPMTPNGKVDIKKLPVPKIKAEDIVKPETEIESKLFTIVSEYLQNEDFGVKTNLVSMGLTSLGAITLSLQLSRKASVELPSSKILESPTIREWAEYLENSSAPKEELTKYEKQEDYPLTENQMGIYIDWEQHKDSIQYNVPMLFRFSNVSADTVVSSVKAFIEAHPYLKTQLKSIDGQIRQLRGDEKEVKVNLTELEKEPSKDFFQKQLKPFNLFEGPLYRFSVYSYDDSVWLLSDIHHIIFDGGSEAILAQEIVKYCNSGSLERERFSAFDYSLYYDAWKASDDYVKAGQYFSSLLEGTAAAQLPSSATGRESGSETVSIRVGRKSLRDCSRKAGITENALILTAVTQVLHRFTREQNIAMLTVSNGRSLKALEGSCGMFVQTLPVVSHLSDCKVSEALTMMHKQIINTLSHDKYPYTKIVEQTGLKADILLAYQGDVLGGPMTIKGETVEMSGLALDTAKMPLSINVNPGEVFTVMDFEYDKSAFNYADIDIFAEAVGNFIENLVNAKADESISGIACVSSSESEKLVDLGRGAELEVAEGTVVNMFKKVAHQTPDAIAVADSETRISYKELDKASDLLAGMLLSAGLRKEDFVSLMLPRSKEFVIAYLSVYKGGGAYVPIDNEYPFDRIQYMIEDSRSRYLITTRELLDRKRAEGELKVENIIFIDDIDFSKASNAAAINNSTPDGLAYMIYTSGTTGKPKGVMIEHHSMMNLIAWESRLGSYVSGTQVAEHASFSFDASVIDLSTTIATGGTLNIIGEECRKDPEMLYKFILDRKIEILTVSTQLGMMMLSSYKLPLRLITMGGEKLTGRYEGDTIIVNGYGPTEFTVCSSYHILDRDKDNDNIPIGRAVPNTVSAIVDPCGQLLPRGVAGELVLIGPQLARGYWNKEDITRKRFVDCPFIPSEKMYHTGDLARWNDEGELLFLGRIDNQVKLRGFRIELGEIESVMSSFKDVTAAVAQVKEVGGVQHLCGYFTAHTKVDTTELKAHLSGSLTSYMVPDALMQLDKLPLTPNGKVDMKRLPLPDLSAKASHDTFEEPKGELEKTIAEIFAKVLGLSEPMSRNSSFFLSGGTSLLVMKVVVMMSEKGYKLTYGDVFKYPTPQSLAAFLDGYQAGSNSVAAPPAPAQTKEVKAICSTGEDGYEYTDINKLLQSNSISEIGDINALDVNPIGDVLLLGSTGFLGIHILNELLSKSQGKIYCVIRAKKGVSCAGRLKSYLMYYFDNTWAELFDKRLFVIEGDMTDELIMDKLLQIKVDTVINCAANVKHFAAGDEIEKINLNGAERLIEYCLKTGSRLIHTSTHSISGQNEEGLPHTMLESELYFGQKMMTKYQTSKFQAERAILQACATRGLKAKIMRLGNLMPRFSDGEFQINIENNGFLSRMRAYYLIGCIPSEHLHSSLEFAPIDETADAILTLAKTPDRFTVFHPFNNHTIYIDDVISVMRKCGLEIKVTNSGEFNSRLEECLKDDHLNPYITTLLAYGSHNNYVMNQPSLDFTVNILNAMNWRWPITGIRYLSDAFEKMIGLEFFDV